ncbi:hypothetical protein CH373_03835 [Leptospira perolatii]|uniref:Exo-alpha-sialidase n=2 Tax=Leptospira perolatii TaxID=2023191 RepID=A0A2M9ZST1_9LEPT|nr:hypothetical protein CH360_14715 [Leptospira perolatii]PJZ75148.1 hypothetical protein CH373_03835 [Leptospira perolatii]
MVLGILAILSCNKAKALDIDASKSPLGLLFDFALANFSPGPQLMAVGDNCSYFSSEDGVNWTVLQGAESPFPGCNGGSIYDVAYGNGTYVAVGTLTASYSTRSNNCGIWVSTDGTTWTRVLCPHGPTSGASAVVDLPLRSLSFGNINGVGTFMAAGLKIEMSSAGNIYGVKSSDGFNWEYTGIVSDYSIPSIFDFTCFITFLDGTAECSIENGSFFDVAKYNPNTGAWNFTTYPGGGTGVEAAGGIQQMAILAATPPPNYSPRTFWMYPAKSGRYFSFGLGNTDSLAIASRRTPSTPWETEKYLSLGINYRINAAADSSSMLLGLGDHCNWVKTTDDGANWTSFATMTGCTRTDWADAAYNATLDLFVAVGKDVGGQIGKAHSPAATSDWQVTTTSLSGRINAIVSK